MCLVLKVRSTYLCGGVDVKVGLYQYEIEDPQAHSQLTCLKQQGGITLENRDSIIDTTGRDCNTTHLLAHFSEEDLFSCVQVTASDSLFQ